MELFGRDLNREVALVAEIGVNHEGDPDTAMKLLHLASEAHADAVKFQSYTPERYASASDPVRLERVERFSLSEETHQHLAAEARELGIAFFSTPLTEDFVPILSELCPVIKIASGDLTFEPVIRSAARTGKPVIMSTGLGTIDDVDRAVQWCRDEIGDEELRNRLVLLHCVSAYPTPIREANILSIPYLAERYGVMVGYSNHVIGWEACAAAVALGARVVEVHFTDQKTGRNFRDHELSFEYADLKQLRQTIDNIASSLGVRDKIIMPSEAVNLQAARKGIVASRDIPAGTTLAREDMMFARPATEFGSGEIGDVVGKTLNCAIERGNLIPRDAVH